MRKRMGIARRDEHGAALARSGQPFRYWRGAEVHECAPHFRLLGYTRSPRHAS